MIIVMTTAHLLPLEKRSVFLERVIAALERRGRMFNDADVRSQSARATEVSWGPLAAIIDLASLKLITSWPSSLLF